MIAIKMTRQRINSAFELPPGLCIKAYNFSFKNPTALIAPEPDTVLKVSPCPKMSIRNGLTIPNETTPKTAESILKPK